MSQMGKGIEILENFVVSPAGIDAKHGVALQTSYIRNASAGLGQVIAER